MRTRQQVLEALAQEAGDGWLLAAQLARLAVLTVRARLVLEVGIGPGIVTVWIADALERTGGRLVSLEQDGQTIERVLERLDALGLAERVQILEGDAHQTCRTVAGPIDVVRLAADRSGYVDYLEAVRPRLRSGGIVIAEGAGHTAAQAFVHALTTDETFATVTFPHRGRTVVGVWLPSQLDTFPAEGG
ncbi:MAG: class I SAM-dependent methyltransferase [Thermomicrobium sp.]|nr:class I SAM-dependent methyltransferase [Thermomicrobium sp.]